MEQGPAAPGTHAQCLVSQGFEGQIARGKASGSESGRAGRAANVRSLHCPGPAQDPLLGAFACQPLSSAHSLFFDQPLKETHLLPQTSAVLRITRDLHLPVC